jgi:hypothetical protein
MFYYSLGACFNHRHMAVLKKRSGIWFFKALGGAKARCPMVIGLLRRECRSALLARTKNDRFEKLNTAELKTAIYARTLPRRFDKIRKN